MDLILELLLTLNFIVCLFSLSFTVHTNSLVLLAVKYWHHNVVVREFGQSDMQIVLFC